MKINKILLTKMSGYDALLYSAMCQLQHPSDDLLQVSNEYLMGRIFELFEHTLVESLSRLEENGYIKTFHLGNGNPYYYLKKSIPSGEYLVIENMEDRLLNPTEKVYIAYLKDMFKSGRKRIRIEETVKIAHPDATYDDEFKERFFFLHYYNILMTDKGYFTNTKPVDNINNSI